MQLIQISDQGHITAHRIILQRTYTMDPPPPLIMSVVECRGSDVGSFHEILAVRAGLMEHVGVAGIVTRYYAEDGSRAVLPQDVLDLADRLLVNVPMRVSEQMGPALCCYDHRAALIGSPLLYRYLIVHPS